MSGLLAKLNGMIAGRTQNVAAAQFRASAEVSQRNQAAASAQGSLQSGSAADATLKQMGQNNPTFAYTVADLKAQGFQLQVKSPVVFASHPSQVSEKSAQSYAQKHAGSLDKDPVYADAKRRNDKLDAPLPLVITLKDGDAKSGVTSAFGHDADGHEGGVVKAEVNVSNGSFAGPQISDAVGQYRNVLSVVEGLQKKTGLTELVAVGA